MKIMRVTALAVIFTVMLGAAACGKTDAAGPVSETTAVSTASVTEPEAAQTTVTEATVPETSVTETTETETEASKNMIMKIGDKAVDVTWEDNASVEEIKELAKNGLTIKMTKYGGFEQVGSIGKNITSNDKQTKTAPGDIVLYAGNSLVVFYGTNSWAYTRLGKINMSKNELKDLLGKGNVTVTLTLE